MRIVEKGRLFGLCPVTAVSVLFTVTCAGAVYTWKGNGVEWAKNSHWSPTGVPTELDYVVFSAAPRKDPFVNANSAAAAINFAAGVRTMTISGTVYTLGMLLGMTNNSVNKQIINAPLNLTGSQEWKAAAGDFSIGGAANLNGNMLTVSGDHDTTINGSISGTGGIIKNGSGTLSLTGNNSFSGPISINGGTLALNSADAIRNVPSITVNAGTLFLGGDGDWAESSAVIRLVGGDLQISDGSDGFGELEISDHSQIKLKPGGTAARLRFARANWTGGSLTIYGWSGQPGHPGTDDRIFFESRPNNIFLIYVTFDGFDPGGMVLEAGGSWELVPVPETSDYALIVGLGLFGFAVHRRLATV
ncbi:MAG: autotransporter-associated beta strand repeat-containing protein [Verrucomicrobiota bacterium]|nr:autotransporter-associated beta strand repeat-containing protein [Verrucomicrobiota bacterium]